MAICNPRSINKKEETISHHCVPEDLNFCLLTETWVKEDDCDGFSKLRKVGYWFRNIPREDKVVGTLD